MAHRTVSAGQQEASTKRSGCACRRVASSPESDWDAWFLGNEANGSLVEDTSATLATEITKSKIKPSEHMKQSRTMSRMKGTTPTPLLPTLPIEVRFEGWPLYRWSIFEDGDDCMFQFHTEAKSYSERELQDLREMLRITFRGTEFLRDLLAIDTPQELVTFMNTYAGPIGIVQDPVDGKYLWKIVPFRWSTFIAAQKKLNQAMSLPIPKLLRHSELNRFFKLETLEITAERRGGVYYGVVTMKPSLSSCFRVIALQRLLGNVEYGICKRCHHPFELTSRHKRKHCYAATCGHAAAQQAYRERKKKEKLKRKLPW